MGSFETIQLYTDPESKCSLVFSAPDASLYERVFNRYEARREHERLEYTLHHEFGIDVFRIKEKLLELADRRPEVRDKLVTAGLNDLNFVGNKKVVAEAEETGSRWFQRLRCRAFFQPTFTPSDNRP